MDNVVYGIFSGRPCTDTEFRAFLCYEAVFIDYVDYWLCANAMSEFNLTIDNLLDRHDNVSHSSAAYYNAPINYMLSYTQKF